MNINIKKVKVGIITQEVKDNLKQGQDVIFQGKGTVTEARFRDNNDGTVNATYIVKPLLIDLRESDTKVRLNDDFQVKQKSEGKALRDRCFAVGNDIGENADELYKICMQAANDKLDEIQDNNKLDNIES